MRRYSLRDAFIGEPNPHQEGLSAVGAGQDAVELEVLGGKLTVLVPHDISDDDLLAQELQSDSMAPWQLELDLENGLHLTLWLPEGPTCADLRVKPKR